MSTAKHYTLESVESMSGGPVAQKPGVITLHSVETAAQSLTEAQPPAGKAVAVTAGKAAPTTTGKVSRGKSKHEDKTDGASNHPEPS